MSGEEKEEEAHYIQRPTVIGEDFIAEEVWDRKNDPQYCVYYWNEDRFDYKDEISLGEIDRKEREIIYRPVDNDDLRKGLVVVPRQPKEGTFKEVVDRAVHFATDGGKTGCYDSTEAKKDIPKIKLLVCISIGSWFLDRFVEDPTIDVAGAGKFAPIIGLRGPSGNGKNRLLTALRLTSYRPYYQISTVRIPSLFRPMDLWGGSLWLDECDVKSTGEKADFTHYLNSRATGTPISRQNPENPRYATAFRNFGLTGVTQRRPWDDNALEGRTVPFTASKTTSEVPTVETDEMLRIGLELQDRLLYLRMKNFHKFKIDKILRIEGISDHRLIASVLPLLSLAKIEPIIGEIVTGIAKEIEREKIKLKALSTDGVIINFLWEKIDSGLFTKWRDAYYILASKTPEKKNEEEETIEEASVTVLTTVAISEELGWSSSFCRRTINSLNLSSAETPTVIKISKRSVKPIFFTVDKLETHLREFVVDYQPSTLASKVGEDAEGKSDLDQYTKPVTDIAEVTDNTQGGSDGKTPSEKQPPHVESVTSVETVTTKESKQDSVWRALETLKDLLAGKNPDITQFSHLGIREHLFRKGIAKTRDEADRLVYRLRDEGHLKESETQRGFFTIVVRAVE